MDYDRITRYSRRQALLAASAALGGLGLGLPRLLDPTAILAAADASLPGDVAGGKGAAMAAHTRAFGFRLFAALTSGRVTDNVLISAPSVAVVLAMLYNGARGETAAAVAETLGVHGMSAAQVNAGFADLTHALARLDPKVQLAIANSLWARQGLPLEPSFVNAVTSAYVATATTLDFNDPRAAATINAWVSRATHGKIERIISDRIDGALVLFLVNAIYFKGAWTTPFERRATAPGTFTLPGSTQKTVNLMSQTLMLPYLKGQGFQGVALPYGAGKLAMYVLLPDQDSSLEALLAQLSAARWDSWMAGFQNTYGHVALPRFSMSYEVKPNLNAALAALGLGVAFDAERADLSGITPVRRAVLSEVRHKTLLEVNEEGATAAAATSGGVSITAVRQLGFDLVVNRPFLCAIRDTTTGTVLFLGTIVNP